MSLLTQSADNLRPAHCATALAPPNIALIKYWGKANHARNTPAVASLSITLDQLETRTEVRFDQTLNRHRFKLNGIDTVDQRVIKTLDKMQALAGFAGAAEVSSENNFPTAAGLASSASGFAALVAACNHALSLKLSETQQALIAREASASAARSFFDGFAYLSAEQSNGETEVVQIADSRHWPLSVVVAITQKEKKAVSSSAGMKSSAATSPYYQAWCAGNDDDIEIAKQAILTRDFEALAEISEHSCLKMHAVMQSSRPALLYWNAATVECMQAIHELRRSGIGVFFTIDAGPQIKAICLPEHEKDVTERLTEIPGVLAFMHSKIGRGAHIIRESQP